MRNHSSLSALSKISQLIDILSPKIFQRLARQGEHGIQSTQVFNILNAGDNIGKLHLRIANIGSVSNVYGKYLVSISTLDGCAV